MSTNYGKINELNLEKDEHKLVNETLEKLEDSRKAYRLIGGVLVETKVGDIAPLIRQFIWHIHSSETRWLPEGEGC